MKILPLLALPLAIASCTSTSNDVEWVDYGPEPMQNPQFLQDMTAAGTPGPQHEALARRVGSWKVEGQMWMEPGAPAMPMTATAEVESILGGRYIVEEFRSDFMGMPFEGRLMQGYDNLTGRYWSVWVDNMSTSCWISYGQETEPGVIEFHGTGRDILTPKGRPMRMVIRTDEDGGCTMKMFDTRPEGGEFCSMELHYTRA